MEQKALHNDTNDQTPIQFADLIKQGDDVEISELDKSGNVQRRWLHRSDNTIAILESKTEPNSIIHSSVREWKRFLSDAFLPIGFPHSVSNDYLAYQTYDSLQAFFSTITSLLANRALLQGLGVGDADSSATFAMLITILTDATSRIATIVFAHRFGLRIEPDAKRFRFLADIFNDSAFFLELYSPYFGDYGKILALSVGQALRALCGVAAGASKAALSVHFAKHDNLAELNAKEASQETAVGLIGLVVGTLVVKLVQDHQSVVYLMVALVFAHLWMNYLGVRSVCMTTLNRQRATILFREYMTTGRVLTPEAVAARENIVLWLPVIGGRLAERVCKIEFAESYQRAAASCNGRRVKVVDGEKYTLFVTEPRDGRIGVIKVLLWFGCEPRHAVLAWFKAMETAWSMDKEGRHVETSAALTQRHADDEDLWKSLGRLGWDLEAQAFETSAPIRLRAQSAARKDE
ncbi:hypothetical protein H634G_01353 [Metarhizium anisopliae BRIP 53293]|uniref:Protein root UVB sensitive/RUS domain-containing protein n=1 Tax=Metarhizium anisopliae BRIP 53293 TaxID=1291518 RepID=A0A0D9PAF4_METAN|nr:hypothetical protein H634G_01353 [Metarhizium anisopliae BRIP 53293]KJK93296.1 hypothetical protein H633G_02832 [Metarhizium anisopliae BRIP 53284]